ncbi:MAG: DUF2721 domain-containing protein [Thainema sp.]
MQITTPALLFPAISLLLLAYTNRFLVLAQLIRQLHSFRREEDNRHLISRQIAGLRQRVSLIQQMQVFGVVSFLLCTASMFSLFLQLEQLGEIFFGLSVLSLATSLIYSLYEVSISTNALSIVLEDMS